jgi:hypothetical protein
MIIILISSGVFIGLNLVLSDFINITWVLLIDIVIWTGANILINRRLKQLGKEL